MTSFDLDELERAVIRSEFDQTARRALLLVLSEYGRLRVQSEDLLAAARALLHCRHAKGEPCDECAERLRRASGAFGRLAS